MKTSEFIKRVEEIGFKTFENETNIIVIHETPHCLVVDKIKEYCMDNNFSAFKNLGVVTKKALFDIAVEYISTPVEEREEEKKYYIKLKGVDGGIKYINLDKYNCRITIDTKSEVYEIQTKFTKHDIEELCLQKFVDSDLFELVEVNE